MNVKLKLNLKLKVKFISGEKKFVKEIVEAWFRLRIRYKFSKADLFQNR